MDDGGDEKPTQTTYERMLANWRRFAVWGSLLAATLGALSAFENVVPALVRLSLIMHGLAWAYRTARDWLFGWLIRAFAAIGIELEISEQVRDTILILGLLLAALNWESTRRTGRNLVLDLFRDVADLANGRRSGRSDSLALQGISKGPKSLRFLAGPTVQLFASLSCAGFAIFFGMRGNSVAIILAYLAALYAFRFWVHRRYPAGWSTTPDVVFRSFGVFMIPGFLIIWPIAAVVEGRRAIFVALALLGALIALNVLMLLYVDPLLATPPDWLQDFIEANPAALRRVE